MVSDCFENTILVKAGQSPMRLNPFSLKEVFTEDLGGVQK